MEAYTFPARGRVTAAFEGVVAKHRQLRDTDFVTVEAIHLEERTTLLSIRPSG